MLTLAVGHIVINSVDPSALADFYLKLLGGKKVDYGNGYIGIDRAPTFPALLFQQADAPAVKPGWMHIDLVLPESARNAAGAAEIKAHIGQASGRFIEIRSDSNFTWMVFEDPDGNPFCIPTSCLLSPG